MSNTTNFEVPTFVEVPGTDAVESAVNVVKDIPVKPFIGRISGKGIVAGMTAVIGLVAIGAIVLKKFKPEEEIRKPDAEAPVELSDEELAELSTAE